MLGFLGHQLVSLRDAPPQGAQLGPWDLPSPTPGSGLWHMGQSFPVGLSFPANEGQMQPRTISPL